MRGRFNGRVIGQDYTGRNTRHNGRAGVYNAVQSAFAPSLDITLANGLGPLFTYTRATTATVTDFEGLIKSCLSGELRVQGARRVRNLRTSSQNSTGLTADKSGLGVNAAFTNNYAEAPDGTMTAMRLVLDCGSTGAGDSSQCYQSLGAAGVNSCWLKSNTGSSFVINGEYTNQTPLTVTTTWQRFSWVGVTSYFGFSNYGNIAGGVQVADVLVWGQQKEDTTGQSNQNPSEYVSVGVLSAPYHGYFVDGVKYFTTQNGNTVASNVVTEAQGAAITGTIGYLAEGAMTDSALYNRDLTQADWSKTNCTAAKDAVGQDGTTNGCSTLTATGANATCLQTVTAGSASKVFQPSIKRKTGTGTIEITVNGGTNWQDVTAQLSTGTWYEAAETRTVTNPQFGFRITTSGDEIIVDYAGCQNGTFRSSSIPTTTAAVARNADVLTCPFAGIGNDVQGAVYIEAITSSTTGNGTSSIPLAFSSNSSLLYLNSGDARTVINSYDGTTVVTKTGLTDISTALRKRACSWGNGGMSITGDGAAPATSVFDGSLGSTSITIGAATGGTSQWFGVIKAVRIYRSRLRDAQLQAMTS